MKSTNLTYLENDWLYGKKAGRAFRKIRGMSPAKKMLLLRHHDEFDRTLTDAETDARDDLDYLLGFYGVVEIACMIGFVDELPQAFKTAHLPLLSDPAVRHYYEYSYPLDLPRRLRDRMQWGLAQRSRSGADAHEAFFRFLDLTRTLETDEDMESFLWCLEAGNRSDGGGNSNSTRLARCLADPKRVGKAWSKKAPDHDIEYAIRGFWKFIQFCDGLEKLLKSLREDPQVAEAMWLNHAYWFRQLQLEFGDDVKLSVKSVLKWQLGGEDQQALRARVAAVEATLESLALPPLVRWPVQIPYETPFSAEAMQAAEAPSELEYTEALVPLKLQFGKKPKDIQIDPTSLLVTEGEYLPLVAAIPKVYVTKHGKAKFTTRDIQEKLEAAFETPEDKIVVGPVAKFHLAKDGTLTLNQATAKAFGLKIAKHFAKGVKPAAGVAMVKAYKHPPAALEET